MSNRVCEVEASCDQAISNMQCDVKHVSAGLI